MEWMAISGYRLPPQLQQQNQDAGGGMANKPAATGQSVGVGVGGPGSLMGVGGHGVPPGSSGPPEMCPPHGVQALAASSITNSLPPTCSTCGRPHKPSK